MYLETFLSIAWFPYYPLVIYEVPLDELFAYSEDNMTTAVTNTSLCNF